MISYVYLDESGQFDANENISIIGGFVYRCEEAEPAHSHRNQIRQEFLRIKRDNQLGDSATFPACLHTTDNDAARNFVRGHLNEVMEELGTGFSLVALFRRRQHNDAAAAERNLWGWQYREMLNAMIDEILACYPEDVIRIYLPTRSETIPADLVEEYRKYDERSVSYDSRAGRWYFSINNMPALASKQDVLDARGNGSGISIQTIQYRREPGSSSEQYGYYLADWVCCWLRGLENPHNPASWKVQREWQRLSRGEPTQISAAFVLPCNDAFRLYQAGVREIRNNHLNGYIDAFAEVFDKKNTEDGPYFMNRLLAYNPFRYQEVTTANNLLREADDYLYGTYYMPARYRRAMMQCEGIQALAEDARVDTLEGMRKIKVKKMGCYQHRGQAREAEAIYDSLISSSLTVYDGLDLCNKYVQSMINMFEYETALKFLKNTMDSNPAPGYFVRPEMAGAPRPEAARDFQGLIARCKSTLGQIYSYMGECYDAENAFREAMRIFSELDEGTNVEITRGHYLHLLIDVGCFGPDEEFFRQAKYLFGNTEFPMEDFRTWSGWFASVIDRLESRVENERHAARYALWRYLTALYAYLVSVVEKEGPNPAWRKNIKDMLFCPQVQEVMEKLQMEGEHPFVLICKYMMLLEQRVTDRGNTYRGMEERYAGSANASATIRIIAHSALLQYAVNDPHLPPSAAEAQKSRLIQATEAVIQDWPESAQQAESAVKKYLEAVRNGEIKDIPGLLTYEFN